MKSKDAAHRTCDMDTLEVIEQNGIGMRMRMR